MVTRLQKARDTRRLPSNDPTAFEFIVAGIGCFIFSFVILFLLPNSTPLLIAAQILFFGIIMFVISILAMLYIMYNKIICGDKIK